MADLIAHRGVNSKLDTENTKEAIINSFNSDYVAGVEIDVRMTKDNKIVVIHDSYINRTSNGIGFIKNMTLKVLKSFNFCSLEKPCKISTLKDILRIVPDDKIILIEIKHIRDNLDKFVKVFLRDIRYFSRKNIFVMSFDKDIIRMLKGASSKIKCGLLVSTVINANHIYADYDFIAISSYSVNKVKNYNKPIFVWALNRKKRYLELKKSMPDNTYYIVDIPSKFI